MPAFGVFVLLPDSQRGRMDQMSRECADVAEMHTAIDEAIAEGSWQAITVIRGQDIPRMLEGAEPTPPG